MSILHSSWARRIAILFLPIFFIQCEGDEPDTNALINCSVSLFSNAALQGKITINDAFINLSQIDITATSPAKDIVNYRLEVSANDSPTPLLNNTRKPFKINARVNNYDPIRITLTMQKDPYELSIDQTDGQVTVNEAGMADFLEHATPGLFISARFDNRGKSVPLHVAITDAFPLSVAGYQYGSPSVRLDLENRAEVIINPAYLFQNVTAQHLDNADKIVYQGQEIILIHPQFNTTLYASILDKLEDTTNSMTFKITVTRSAQDQ